MQKSGFLVEGREVTFWHVGMERIITGTLTGREEVPSDFWLSTLDEKRANLLIEIRWQARNGMVHRSAVRRANILTPESLD